MTALVIENAERRLIEQEPNLDHLHGLSDERRQEIRRSLAGFRHAAQCDLNNCPVGFCCRYKHLITHHDLCRIPFPMSVYCVDCREWRDIMPYHLQYCHNAMCRMPICVWQRHRNDERPARAA
ncbi:hypothetical protein L596_010926 [Steinernema carpocapsae]|uniref:TAZ-type domain-containing protein n=1 Tax=Steinernema carpocapsae TaxID=34508 RepID=A0A4U5PKK8_STECR|nr:hypothetical protein L596_010926 [Steinernema carpocapsae]